MNKQLSYLGKLAKQCEEDSIRWFGDTGATTGMRGLIHHSLAMAGEVGEFCNVLKKIDRGSLELRAPATRIMLANELTDVFVYLLNIAALLGIDLDATYQSVRANNDKRFLKQRSEREARVTENVQG